MVLGNKMIMIAWINFSSKQGGVSKKSFKILDLQFDLDWNVTARKHRSALCTSINCSERHGASCGSFDFWGKNNIPICHLKDCKRMQSNLDFVWHWGTAEWKRGGEGQFDNHDGVCSVGWRPDQPGGVYGGQKSAKYGCCKASSAEILWTGLHFNRFWGEEGRKHQRSLQKRSHSNTVSVVESNFQSTVLSILAA